MNQLTLKIFEGFTFTFLILYQLLLTLFTDGEQKGDFTKISYTNPTNDEILHDYTLAKEDIPKKLNHVRQPFVLLV